MSPPLPSGCYPIERRSGEIERLRIQAAAMAFDATVMLDRIGVRPGWCCLDLGCGAGGILDLLAERVGPAGLALGLDADPVLLAAARQGLGDRPGMALVASDGYRAALRAESFDLVHVRFVASTPGFVVVQLRVALRLGRPGGGLAFQEPDTATHRLLAAWRVHERLAAAGAARAR